MMLLATNDGRIICEECKMMETKEKQERKWKMKKKQREI